MEGKKRPKLRMLVSRCHHGGSERHWRHSRRMVRTSSPIKDWKLVPKKPHDYLTILLGIDLSKYLPNLNIEKRLLNFGKNERNNTHKINVRLLKTKKTLNMHT